MRTTLQIDDDILEAARSLARAEHKTVGRVISDLARRGLRPRRQETNHAGFPVFEVSPNAGPLTLELVKQAENEP